MRIVIQRVSEASVTINGHQKSAIQKGFRLGLAFCVVDIPESGLLAQVISFR